MSDDLFDVFVEEAEGEQVAAYTLPTKLSTTEPLSPKANTNAGQKRELSDNEDTQSDRKRFEQEDFEKTLIKICDWKLKLLKKNFWLLIFEVSLVT